METKVGFDYSIFLNKEVDAYPVFENTQVVEIKQKGYDINVINPVDYGIKSYSNLYFTTEDIIKNNPEKVQNFLTGVLSAWKYTINNPDIAIESVNKYAKDIDPKINLISLRETLKLVQPSSDIQIGNMTNEVWKNTQNILLENKVLDQEIDLSQAFTNKFLKKSY